MSPAAANLGHPLSYGSCNIPLPCVSQNINHARTKVNFIIRALLTGHGPIHDRLMRMVGITDPDEDGSSCGY